MAELKATTINGNLIIGSASTNYTAMLNNKALTTVLTGTDTTTRDNNTNSCAKLRIAVNNGIMSIWSS